MTDEPRRFLLATAALGVGSLIPIRALAEEKKPDAKKDEDEVGAAEDLMREHGVLNRILLIYEEGLRRLTAKEEVPPDDFHKPALLVRNFVEDYHEKLEENFIFPEFEKKKKLVDLVKVLREQHEAGRRVTDVILRNAVADLRATDTSARLAVDVSEAVWWKPVPCKVGRTGAGTGCSINRRSFWLRSAQTARHGLLCRCKQATSLPSGTWKATVDLYVTVFLCSA